MNLAECPERTRAHYIEALSRNYVERFFLLSGHTVDEPRLDYGYDLVVTTYDYHGNKRFESGEIENGQILVQLKATDDLKASKQDPTKITFLIKRRHVVLWKNEPMPVFLIVYSTQREEAYWQHLQGYFASPGFKMPPASQEMVTVRISVANIVNEDAITKFRGYKEERVTYFQKEWDQNG